MNPLVLAAVAGWLSLAGLSGWIAAQKNRSVFEGLVLGLLFGPLGALIEALLPVGDRQPRPQPQPVAEEPISQRTMVWGGVLIAVLFVMIWICALLAY